MSDKKICPQCGTECYSNVVYCGNCGYKFEEFAQVAEQIEEAKKYREKNIEYKEYENKNDEPNFIIRLIQDLFDSVGFLISAAVISLLFIFAMYCGLQSVLDNIHTNNAPFQVIYDLVASTSIVLGIGIGVIAGLTVTAFSRNNAKLKKIEKMLKEIQENIQK